MTKFENVLKDILYSEEMMSGDVMGSTVTPSEVIPNPEKEDEYATGDASNPLGLGYVGRFNKKHKCKHKGKHKCKNKGKHKVLAESNFSTNMSIGSLEESPTLEDFPEFQGLDIIRHGVFLVDPESVSSIFDTKSAIVNDILRKTESFYGNDTIFYTNPTIEELSKDINKIAYDAIPSYVLVATYHNGEVGRFRKKHKVDFVYKIIPA